MNREEVYLDQYTYEHLPQAIALLDSDEWLQLFHPPVYPSEHEEIQKLRLAVSTVLTALRGPQPDPITGLVPCDFCTDTFDQKPLLQENKYEPYTCMMSTISIEENNGKHQIEIDLWDGGNVYAAFEINYCPMCGRKLTAPSPSGAIGPEQDGTAPNGDKGANK
jgi:hypothetical protein